MTDICWYLQVHQPYRLTGFRIFDIGRRAPYFDAAHNRQIIRRVADRCYLPANQLLARLIAESDGRFRVAMSISGTVLQQLEADAPDALDSFQTLVATGGVELLGETYYHSLSALADPDEFCQQVEMHRALVHRLFGQRPTVFRNTELIFSDEIARLVQRFGFAGALVEGASQILGGRPATAIYESAAAPGLRLLARHYPLSDDIAFRFSAREWNQWPLKADSYASWLAATPGDSLNLFMDYETFGEHQWAETGIFDFLARLPTECFARGLTFAHPSTLATRPPAGALSFPRPTSWADQERDVSAWLGNRMQQAAHARAYALRLAVADAGIPELMEDWRRLTTSDHFYYMATKEHSDQTVHAYFSPYQSPYDAFIRYMNVMQDVEQQAVGVG
jgi:alpha-amylase